MMKKTILLYASLMICAAFNSPYFHKSELLNQSVPLQLANGGEETTFVHTVFFWMKEDLTDAEARFFEEGMEKLGQVPSILSYTWGKPAGTPRDVVDNSYTYAWIVEFANKADHNAYQEDPVHLKFIDECKDLWTKVQVYDTLLK